MDFRFDEKGKFYTEVITKEAVAVMIQTHSFRIRGHIYIRPENRLIDELNQSDRFLALTNVVVLNLDGEILKRAEFLSINRDHIIWIVPAQDLIEDRASGGAS